MARQTNDIRDTAQPQLIPGPAPERRGRPGEKGGATPWQLDTRKAEPRKPAPPPAEPMCIDDVAKSYLGLCDNRKNGVSREALDRWQVSIGNGGAVVGLFHDLHLVDPAEASRVARGLISLPEPGDSFLGFRLVDELGRGAFGRVYLAQQGDLADRYVALKVSTELKGESQTLAQLQHTNIVPIFSVHHAEPFQAVCMPFYGMTTLKDICDDLERVGETPASGRSLLKNLSSRRSIHRVARSSTVDGQPVLSNLDDPEMSASVADEPASADVAEDRPGSASVSNPLSNTLRMIGELPYHEAVLWMGSRLADGLAHAHERGILHRDLKPANVLLTDDGQPMILDFNLSHNSQSTGMASAASIGGTLPYMSPEHLASFRGEAREVDARSDLYALGIILYELLARRHPFPVHENSTPETLGRMIEERLGPPPLIRPWNDRVSPAAESIIRHCLEPNPARRYQTVRDLHEDLERHLAHLPLRYAPEPSIRERAHKLFCRNPRLASWVGIGFAVFALATAMTGLVLRNQKLAHLESLKSLETFHEDLDSARSILSVKSEDRSQRDRGIRMVEHVLGQYRVLDSSDWRRSAAVAELPPRDQNRLRDDVGETLTMLAEVSARNASDSPDPAARTTQALAGLMFSGLAMDCFEKEPPRSLLEQRADLMKFLGREGDALILLDQAEQVPMKTARDFLMASTDHLIRGEIDEALTLAEKATRRDPTSFWAWFNLGICHDRRERPALAIACFHTCVALRPDFQYSWLNRGLCYLRDSKPEQARADFDRAIELKPEWHEPYLNRAQARSLLGDHRGAVSDLTLALERGATETQIFFLRAEALARAGDNEGARKDREIGLSKVPSNAASWIARGQERMTSDPAGALADFEKASELEPTSLRALHMRAHLLALRFRRLDDAASLLDKAITLYPEYVPARAFRGVIRAVQGRRDEAHRDAEEARWRDSSPPNLYQLAGIYATTSKQVPEDRAEAFQLIYAALRQGFGFDLIAIDDELAPIRDLPEFRRLVESAKRAQSVKPRPAKL